MPKLTSLLSLTLLLLTEPILSTPPPKFSNTTYDYIVIGSGPGGGTVASNLARSNHTVLLLDAGDLSTPSPTSYHQYPSSLTWDFFVKHYASPEKQLKNNHLTWRTKEGRYWVGKGVGEEKPEGAELLGVYYPRGATVGGSSMINAMVTFLPSERDWEVIVNVTGDGSWSPSNMRKVFQKIEHNNYLPSSTAGHGFTGFFNTMMPTPQNVSNPGLAALNAAAESFAIPTSQLTAMLARDPNALDSNRDHSTGIFGLASHTRVNGQRWSSRDYIQDTINAGFPLTLSKNSLATRVLFDKTGCGSKPRATGVEYLVGKSLYKADARYDANNKGVLTQAIARKEVILSGGAFNTPQLLMLSGIGPAAQLSQFNISLVVDSPGVGTNLQDNQEIPTVGLFPTVQYGSAGGCIMRQTPFAPYAERDIFVMQFPGVFRGFWPSNQTNTNLTQDIPGSYGISLVKMHPQNRAGTVRLLSSDPRDMPEINFNLFEQGRDVDIGAMKDTVAWARKIFGSIKGPVGPVEVLEPKCESVDAGGSCGKVDEDWIEGQTFGHHPTSTAAIGADGDPNAVLDSRFNVRGVKGLRVVDASVFPQIPGVFPVVSTFMVGQKGSDVIIEDANKDVCGSST